MSDTVGSDGILRAKLRIQNVGFGNLTRKMKVSLYVHGMTNIGPLDTIAALNINKPLEHVDFMKVHSRKIEIKGADTVMTFDGNNEISIEANVGCHSDWSGVHLDVELKVCSETNPEDCIWFANKNCYKKGYIVDDDACLESDKAYIGNFVMGNCDRTSIPHSLSKTAPKINAPFVQRNRNNVIIRKGEKRYRANGVVPLF